MAGVLPTLATGEKEVVENGTKPKARPIGNLNLNGRCIKTRQIPTWKVHEVIPQSRNGKQIVRKVKVATTSTDESTGEVKVVYVLRDLSCIAPVDCPLDSWISTWQG